MLVEEIMTKEVVAIGPEMPIGDVHILMERRNVRHFPVLEVAQVRASKNSHSQASIEQELASPNPAGPLDDDDAKLVGIVSDRDIRAVGSPLPNAKQGVTLQDPVRRIMVSPVLSAHPLDPIEESASVLREHKIGAMPVLNGDTLVGIVTSTDFLESLVKMTGVQGAATRLEIEVENRPNALARLVAAVAEEDVGILSVLTHTRDAADEGTICFVLRVDTIDGRGLANSLREKGFRVLWPPEKGRQP